MQRQVNIIQNNSDSAIENTESSLYSFEFLLKNYFNLFTERKINSGDKLKKVDKLIRFHLPSELNELFLTHFEAPLYWICDNSLNKYIREFYKYHLPKPDVPDLYLSQKDAYTRWFFNKIDSEKKYFASTLINIVDNSGIKNNFLGLALKGVIFIYEKQIFNPLKALELFEQAKIIVNSIKFNDDAKREFEYIIELFSAFAFLKLKEDDNVQQKLFNALTLKPNGITAKFYLALVNISLGYPDVSEYFLKEIVNYEISRLVYSYNNNNAELLKYLLEHPVLENMHHYHGFSSLIDKLINYFENGKSSGSKIIIGLKDKTERITRLNILQSYSDEINKRILVIKEVLELINQTNHIYLYYLTENLQNDFNASLNNLIGIIRNKYDSSIDEKFISIDTEIKENSILLDQYRTKLESQKGKIKTKLSESIKSLEEITSQQIKDFEEKVTLLSNENITSTNRVFIQTMGYNTLLTIVVTLMGGCAGYSNSYLSNVSELKLLLSNTFVTGLKWGIITFLTGILISILASGYSFIERKNSKQKILKKISRLKNEKDGLIKHLITESEIKEKDLIENFNNEIDKIRTRINGLIQFKEDRKTELKKEAEKLFAEEACIFRELLI